MADEKILIVDDEDDSVAYITSVLEREGRTIITARDGEAGLKAVHAEKPDLVIMDVQMPKKDGFTLFAQMRHDEATKGIPVIVITGAGSATGVRFSASDMGEFLGVEPEEYIEKPLEASALESAVLRILGS